MAAYIAEGRLAPANGRNPGRQDRRAAPVCSFVVPKMGPKTRPKNRAAVFPEEGKALGLTKPHPSFTIEGPPSRLHFSYADAAPKAGPGGSAVCAQAD